MSYIARVIRVVIASPSDVAEERGVARDVILEWNAVNAEDRATVLLPILWETHAVPAMGERAQEVINKQLIRDADVLVGVFWTRIGTPTGVAPSGTVEEIEEHVKKGTGPMLYFSAAPVRLDFVDEHQYRALKEFRQQCRERGLVEEYESLAEFREKFRRQLAQRIIQRFPPPRPDTLRVSDQSVSAGRTAAASPSDGLSPDATELLLEAIQDGTVLSLDTLGGSHVQTNGKDFVAPDDRRSEARWKAAVEELVERGLLRQTDLEGEVFSVTDLGYKTGDRLAPH